MKTIKPYNNGQPVNRTREEQRRIRQMARKRAKDRGEALTEAIARGVVDRSELTEAGRAMLPGGTAK